MARMTGSPKPNSGRLIFITHEFAPFRGGVATFVEETARALHRNGAPVEVWAPDYGIQSHEQLDFPVVRMRSGGSLKWRDVTQFKRELARRRGDWKNSTVVLSSVGTHLASMRWVSAGRMRAQALVSLLHGSEVLRFGRNPIWRVLARLLFCDVEGIVTVSEFSRDLIQHSFLSSYRGTIEIAPCACTTAATRNVSAAKNEDGKSRVLTLARMHPRKGQIETAQALGNLPAELRQRVIYQVGGTGDLEYLTQVESTCAAKGVEFKYLGEVPQEKLAEMYAQCDIFAMTSLRLASSVEGFGIVYLDAGFHGKPVVAYRSGGAEEAVLDGKTGLLVPEGDVGALTEAFAKLIRDSALRERLGAAGKEHAMARNWDNAAKVFASFGQ